MIRAIEQSMFQSTATDFANEREKLVSRVENRKDRKSAPPKAAPAAPKVDSDGFLVASGTMKYEPISMRDPFRSFEWEQMRLDLLGAEGGPLEQFDVNQLALIGVVWDADYL